MSTDDKHSQLLRTKINGETSRMPWSELQRFFASGSVIAVDERLDLVDVAVRIASDDTAAVTKWMNDHMLGRASDVQAETWLKTDAVLWAVVVKPWILVQPDKRH